MYRTFRIKTLGCKVNQYDKQAIREELLRRGLAEAPPGAGADLVIVNTCTVTARADEKCRKEARRAVRENPCAAIVVTGCAAESDPETYRAMPGIAGVFAKSAMSRIGEFLAGGEPGAGDVFDLEISAFSGRTRAFVRIQEGCDAFCSYCIVPRVRGRARSRPLAAIGPEVRRLAEAGHREIVLTGIHLGAYGKDLGGVTLADAVREALAACGGARLRLSSVEASEVQPELLDLMAEDPRLCPHLHMPLQSGDAAVLRAMNRPYSPDDYLRAVDRVRERIERPALTTDVMVGFPGETEQQFRNTLETCRKAGFTRLHVFPYSPRKGTPAAELPPLPAATVKEREERALALGRKLASSYRRTFIGETVEPLAESRRDKATGLLVGLTERYVSVRFQGSDSLMNTIVSVRAESADEDGLRGVWLGRL